MEMHMVKLFVDNLKQLIYHQIKMYQVQTRIIDYQTMQRGK